MSKILTMTRAQLDDYSIGIIHAPDRKLYTIERPWLPIEGSKGGTPSKSCIPFGKYELEHHSGGKYKDVWALVNHELDVVHWPEQRDEKLDRSTCLIHSANYWYQVKGCIAPGLSGKVTPDGVCYVSQSRLAIDYLRTIMQEYSHLEILEVKYEGNSWDH